MNSMFLNVVFKKWHKKRRKNLNYATATAATPLSQNFAPLLPESPVMVLRRWCEDAAFQAVTHSVVPRWGRGEAEGGYVPGRNIEGEQKTYFRGNGEMKSVT